MNRIVSISVLAFFLLAAISAAVLSQNDIKGTNLTDADNDEVMMGGYLLLRIRCASAGFTIEQRVEAVQKRIIELLSNGKTQLPEIKIVAVGQSASLYAGDMLIITATPCDAKANGTTPQKLAAVWGKRLQAIYPKAIPLQPNSNR